MSNILNLKTGEPFDPLPRLHHKPETSLAVSSSELSPRARGWTMAAHSFYIGGKKLPYDYEVEWIGGDGNVYFKTSVKFVDKHYAIEIDRYIAQYVGSTITRHIISAYGMSSKNFRISSVRDNSGRNIKIETLSNGGNGPKLDAGTSTADYEWKNLKLDTGLGSISAVGLSNSTTPYTSNTYGECVRIFAYNNTASKGQCGRIRMWVEGELVIDAIPCVINGVGEYYDTVTSAPLTKVGTGTISVGPRV